MSHHFRKNRDLFWPLLLIIIGLLFLFQNLGYLDIGDVISDYWPVFLIVWGVSLILKRRPVSEDEPLPVNEKNFDKSSAILSNDKISFSKTFGDLHLTANSKNFKGGDINNSFGEIHLNLQDIELSEGEQILMVNGVFGDIHIALPRNCAVKIESSVTGGSIRIFNEKVDGFSKQLFHQTKDYDTAAKKLKIMVSLTFGDIVVW